MDRLGPLVATAAAPTAGEVSRGARAARAAGADRVEVRLDLLDPGESPRALFALAAEMPLLVSGRRDRFRPEELPLLQEAQARGAWVDLPLRDAPESAWRALDPSRLVLSDHEFDGTPADLAERARRLLARPAAARKLAVTACSLGDVLSVRALLASLPSGAALCAFCMGQAGLLSRLLALAWGSEATYAAAPHCGPAAPGQLPLEDLLAVAPFTLTPETPLYLLAGWPLDFTASPRLVNRWLRAAGRPERYLPCPAESPADFLALLSALPAAGAAVTVPHKEALLPHLAGLSRLAAATGAVNTLLPGPTGGWSGANTDVFGVRRALSALPARPRRTLLLGAGGAAAAAALALRGRGPVAVTARTAARAEALARRLGLEAVPWDRRGGMPWDLLVNATPLGRREGELPLPEERLGGKAVLEMVVRRAGETPLVKAARARGLQVLPGEGMLAAQAALQFRLWTGRRPPARVSLESTHHGPC